MRAETKVHLAALATVPFVMVLSNSLLIPILPAMQKALHLSAMQAGLVITAFSVPAGLFIPLGGYLSDRFGRKAVMVPALFLFGLGGLLAGLAALVLAKAYLAILGARVLQGIGGGGTYQVAMAMTGDMFQSRERTKALGVLEASNGLGKVVAPILGATTALIVWHAPYFVYPLLAWPSALAVWFLVEEHGRAAARSQPAREYVVDLAPTWRGQGKTLLTAFWAGMMALFVLFGVLSHFSDVLEARWGIRGFVKGFVIAIPVLAMAVTSYLTGVYLQKGTPGAVKAALVAGLACMAAGMAASYFLRSLTGFTSALAAVGFGTGLGLPALNIIVTGAAGSGKRGLITSLYGSVRFFGAALGPPAAARVAALNPAALSLGGAALGAATAMAALLLVQTRSALPAGGAQGRERRAS